MVKHKRKGPEDPGKKSKKQKATPAEETPSAPEAKPCKEAAGPEVREASPELSPEERRVVERKLKKERKKEEKKRLREAGIAGAQTARVQTPPASPSAAGCRSGPGVPPRVGPEAGELEIPEEEADVAPAAHV